MALAAHDDLQSDDDGLSKESLTLSLDDIYAALDAAGAADFNLERDLSLPADAGVCEYSELGA